MLFTHYLMSETIARLIAPVTLLLSLKLGKKYCVTLELCLFVLYILCETVGCIVFMLSKAFESTSE